MKELIAEKNELLSKLAKLQVKLNLIYLIDYTIFKMINFTNRKNLKIWINKDKTTMLMIKKNVLEELLMK